MKRENELGIVYSTSLKSVISAANNGLCFHIVCLSGEGHFTYNGRKFCIKKNDAMVIMDPKKVRIGRQTDDLEVEIVAGVQGRLYNLLPMNCHGASSEANLFKKPLMHLSDENAAKLLTDMRHIRDRVADTGDMFYNELLASLVVTMIYDLFSFHAECHKPIFSSDRSVYVVQSLISLLEGGRCKTHRDVAYYASILKVTPKYLSETVKRHTGQSATYYIDRYTMPMVKRYLDGSEMSVSEIADEMNFSSVAYFSRYVAKHLGMSPTAYRQITETEEK